MALITDLDQDMPPLPLDTAGVHQAVLNLLNNALDAAEAKTGAVVMRSEYDDQAQRARVTVTDNGVGISDANRQNLFEPFYSTKDDGVGLGLATVDSLVSALGGTVKIGNTPENGAFVELEVPDFEGEYAK